MTKRVSVAVPDSLYRELSAEAAERQVDLSEVVRQRLSGSPRANVVKPEGLTQTEAATSAPSVPQNLSENIRLMTDEDLLRELKIRKDRRDEEKHRLDSALKLAKLKRITPSRGELPCPLGNCAAEKQGLIFRNQEELNEHYYLAHRDRLSELPQSEGILR